LLDFQMEPPSNQTYYDNVLYVWFTCLDTGREGDLFFLVIKEMHGEFRNIFSGFSFIYLFIYFSYQLIAYSTLQVFLYLCPF
jgi:hypothetical protein